MMEQGLVVQIIPIAEQYQLLKVREMSNQRQILTENELLIKWIGIITNQLQILMMQAL